MSSFKVMFGIETAPFQLKTLMFIYRREIKWSSTAFQAHVVNKLDLLRRLRPHLAT